MAKRINKSNAPKSLIGIDPLAWLDETTIDSETNQTDDESEIEVSAEPLLVNETVNQEGSSDLGMHSENHGDADNCEVEATEKTDEKLILNNVTKLDSVKGLHKELSKRLANVGEIEIDAQQVQTIDTASLQLLSLFVGEATSRGARVLIQHPSDPFTYAAKILGLQNLIELTDPLVKSD